MSEQPDIRLTVRARNARLLRAMERAGFTSVAALARAMGVKVGHSGYCMLAEIVGFRSAPITREGTWREIAIAAATALHVEPEELWPEYLQRIEMKRPEVSIDVSVEQMASLAGGGRLLLEHDAVARLLKRLEPRERAVVELRYGLNGNGVHTLREISELLPDVGGPANVGQIEHQALRRMHKGIDDDVTSDDFVGELP